MPKKTKVKQTQADIDRQIELEELEPILKNANKPTWGHRIWVALQVLFWMAVFVAGMWYYQQLKINQLETQKSEITKELEEAKAAKKKAEEELVAAQKELASTSSTVTTVPPLLKQTVKSSVESGNYTALEPYIADKVSYAIAASSGQGTLTKAQALKQLEYLNTGTSPWNFDIANDTLIKYKSGAYSNYLNDDVIFGVSGNKFFVSFHLDTNNKIDQFFIASNTDLL